MTSVLIIKGDDSWGPPTWIFKEALRQIVRQLDAEEQSLIEKLEWPIDKTPFVDFSELDSRQIKVIHLAIANAIDELIEKWPPPPVPTIDYSFLFRFSQFKALFHFDSRLVFEDREKAVALSDTSSWHAPQWAHNMILEHIIFWLLDEGYSSEASRLKQALYGNEDTSNLMHLNDQERCLLFEPTKTLVSQYVEYPGRGVTAPAFLEAILPYVKSWAEALRSTLQTVNCDNAIS